MQQVDGTTGQPVGAPTARAPASSGVDNNSFGVALACGVTCRLVWRRAVRLESDCSSRGGSEEGAPATVANLAGTAQSAGRVVADAYRGDGRLWVAWWNGKTYSDELGDAKGVGGVVQDDGVRASSAAPTR